MPELTVLDIFCGAGGFSEGFRQQGFTVVGGIDRWVPAVETFDHNFGTNSLVQDILSFQRPVDKIESLPDTDVILGSPPCVSFSHSNASGKADKKSGILLTKLFLKIVAVKKFKRGSRLKAWYMENVVNSMKYLPPFYRFKDLGLAAWAKKEGFDPSSVAIALKNNQIVVNAADYGAPQKRIRLISGEIIGRNSSRISIGSFPVPPATHREPRGQDGLFDELSPHKRLAEIRQALPAPNTPKSQITVHDPQYYGITIPLERLSDHFYDTGLYECEWQAARYLKTNHPYMGRMSFPEDEERPSRTVMATRIGVSREAMLFPSEYRRVGNGEYRTATVREAACLMGFPITYQFKGSEGIKWKLVGNAVCPHVSFAFAKELKKQLGMPVIEIPSVQRTAQLSGVTNLNTFGKKTFENPPLKNRNSRFRRHPFKDGNITVTLSNYDIAKNSLHLGRWITSIQYGCGAGFPIYKCSDSVHEALEAVIAEFETGKVFLEHINNGFLDKIGSSSALQELYERRRNDNSLLGPIELVDEVARIIDSLKIDAEIFIQKKKKFFRNKNEVPLKQLFALYAISRISSKANSHE